MSESQAILERIRSKRVHVVETLYGEAFKLRRFSTAFVMAQQQELGEGGQPRDPAASNRATVIASLVEPEPTPEVIATLEEDFAAWRDLIERIMDLNGLTADSRRAVARDFRAGDGVPEGPSQGG